MIDSSNPGVQLDFEVILNCLHHLRPSLETLNFYVVHPDVGFLEYNKYVNNVPSLKDFCNLKQLSIPSEWIHIMAYGPETFMDTDILPETLEVLQVEIPWRYTPDYLLELINQCRNANSLLALHKVRLYCTNKRGLGYEPLKYYPEHVGQLQKIREHGIDVELLCHPLEYKPEWDDVDYDPCAALMLEHLQWLGRSYRGGS